MAELNAGAGTAQPGDSPALLDDVSPAQWLAKRLRSPEEHRVGSVVPQGFAAYARLLHPATSVVRGGENLRWSEVSAWSGATLSSKSSWRDVALPEHSPRSTPPWRAPGPAEGRPATKDVRTLVRHLALETAASDVCYFAVWEGSVAGQSALLTERGTAREVIPAPEPPREVVALPWRNYWLYRGTLGEVTNIAPDRWGAVSANLWWPEDHSWCVASEIDLPWTYLAGTEELVSAVVTDSSLEATRVRPDDDYISQLPEWLSERIGRATSELLDVGSCTLDLSLGTIHATWRRLRGRRRGELVTASRGRNGEQASKRFLASRDREQLRRLVSFALQSAIDALCDG